jgi:dienelactone hydrolase
MTSPLCCPPNSHGYLAPDYQEVGKTQALPDGTEFYSSGSPAPGKHAILVVPDIFGWHGGRIRNIADQFAEAGFYAVVPKLLVPSYGPGTDDGSKSEFEMLNCDINFCIRCSRGFQRLG